MAEPWLRGTLKDVDALRRQVLHALEQAREDVERWCSHLSDRQIHSRPAGVNSVAYHVRHIAGSLDRLLSYAEGQQLSPEQLQTAAAEQEPVGSAKDLLEEFHAGIARASARVLELSPLQYEETRFVGRQRIATTLGSLLVHCAEHTQRHVGQTITTAKIAAAN